MSVIVNLSLLGFFKYGDFVIENYNFLGHQFGFEPTPFMDLVLPVGISFYTFQTLSYTIDVYRRRTQPTKDLLTFSLYACFFPQLVAGPIERARNLIPQFVEKKAVTRADLEAGFQRFLWGYVKKVVISDRLGLMVGEVYANPGEASAPELIVATLCFTFQLYLDFSAYTDIAIGTARMMGIKLSENFNWPLLAKNPSDFWARWHITLTNWFRDYVHPLLGGASRSRVARTLFNTVFVMTLVDFWHGADWNFIMFGFMSGLCVAFYQWLRLFSGRKKRGPLLGNYWWSRPAAVLICIIPLNTIMVFFRASDFPTALQVLCGMFTHPWSWSSHFDTQLYMLIAVWGIHIYRGLDPKSRQDREMPAIVRGAFWFLLLLAIIFGAVDSSEKFIYFQF